jgi:hypothetical protein
MATRLVQINMKARDDSALGGFWAEALGTAVVKALDAFFGTDKIPFTLDSRATHTTREYKRLHNIVKEVDRARILVGFHFRNSDLQGSTLGGKVGRYVVPR